jgi:hypothetical protein
LTPHGLRHRREPTTIIETETKTQLLQPGFR